MFLSLVLPAVLGTVGVYLLLPRVRPYPTFWGVAASALALILAGFTLIRSGMAVPDKLLFYCFSALAIVSATMLITQRNPVHAALSFALVVLSTCGLFLLQAAPFLMAATIIVYAGAIVVTFLFVIMLAQQEGISSADQRSREPFLATVAGFVLLGALLCVLHRNYEFNPQLDELLARADRALAAGSVEEADRALGGQEEYVNALYKLVPEEAPDGRERKRVGWWVSTRGRLREAAADMQGRFRDEDLNGVREELRKIRDIGAEMRLARGGLLADKDTPLSRFSGAPPSAAPPVDEK